METGKKQHATALPVETTRREALEALGRVAKYMAPATLVLVSSVSSAGSVQ